MENGNFQLFLRHERRIPSVQQPLAIQSELTINFQVGAAQPQHTAKMLI